MARGLIKFLFIKFLFIKGYQQRVAHHAWTFMASA